MCLVCIDLVKLKMSVIEAERNLGELIQIAPDYRTFRHYSDLQDALRVMDEDILKTYFNRVKEDIV